MRQIPAALAAKFRQAIQTRAAGADPWLDCWISRPVTPMTDTFFFEWQTVKETETATVCDIAVCHPTRGKQSTWICLALVEGGTAKVLTSTFRQVMSAHAWTDMGFSAQASDVAVAYDATMQADDRGLLEFVTETQPWIFWTSGGALYARKLGQAGTVTLAEANCTKVSAVRAPWSQIEGFDFGLCVFFLLSGAVYYRQLINGAWTDAEPVLFGPSGVSWADIAAFRTWDYRIGLQCIDGDGKLYELYTQYGGFGSRNQERIELRDINAVGSLIGVTYHDTTDTEHLEIPSVIAGASYGGLYATAAPTMLSASNANDGTGDWGKMLTVAFDVHLEPSSVAANATAFTILDAKGAVFTASAVQVGPDGKTVFLTFADFNAASGTCQARYVPGTAVTMAGTTITATAVSFMPENLVPPQVDPPVPVNAWNE